MWSPSSRTYAMGECVAAYVLSLRFKRVLFSCYCFCNLNLINYCTSLKCSMNAVVCNSCLTFAMGGVAPIAVSEPGGMKLSAKHEPSIKVALAIRYRAQRCSRPIIVRVQSEQGNTLVLPLDLTYLLTT